MHRTTFFWRRLWCVFLIYESGLIVSVWFKLPLHSHSSIDILRLYESEYFFPSHIIDLDYWTFLAWNKKISVTLYCIILLNFNGIFVLLESHSIFSNNTPLFEILMHSWLIPIGLLSRRCIRYKFFLFHFREPVWILNICQIQKKRSLTLADWMKILFWQLLHT